MEEKASPQLDVAQSRWLKTVLQMLQARLAPHSASGGVGHGAPLGLADIKSLPPSDFSEVSVLPRFFDGSAIHDPESEPVHADSPIPPVRPMPADLKMFELRQALSRGGFPVAEKVVPGLTGTEAGNKNSLEKWAYVGSIMLLLAHHGVIDAWLWHADVPPALKTDLFYLGGTAVCVAGITMAAYSYNEALEDVHLAWWNYTKTTGGALLLGSITWDLIYGTLRDNDAFYPFKSWYGNFGFKNKTQRITFDVSRLLLGLYLIISSD